MTSDEILKELATYFGAGSQDGLTAREIARALGVSKHSVIAVLQQLIAKGTWEVVRVQRRRIDGVMQLCPGYRPRKS